METEKHKRLKTEKYKRLKTEKYKRLRWKKKTGKTGPRVVKLLKTEGFNGLPDVAKIAYVQRVWEVDCAEADRILEAYHVATYQELQHGPPLVGNEEVHKVENREVQKVKSASPALGLRSGEKLAKTPITLIPIKAESKLRIMSKLLSILTNTSKTVAFKLFMAVSLSFSTAIFELMYPLAANDVGWYAFHATLNVLAGVASLNVFCIAFGFGGLSTVIVFLIKYGFDMRVWTNTLSWNIVYQIGWLAVWIVACVSAYARLIYSDRQTQSHSNSQIRLVKCK